jgi:hypothetical protein
MLGKLSDYLWNMKENKVTLKAGHSFTDILYANGASSNPKVARVLSNGDDALNSLHALTKGTAKITFNKGKGKKPATLEVRVTDNPALTRGGKIISSVSVKKGKTVKVKITGKSNAVNNKYANTKIAKVISKKNIRVISVKGLKKGSTTLKITVNGRVLKLKVRVK